MSAKSKSGFYKGDLVRVSDALLKSYEVNAPRKHASFYGVVELTATEIHRWYSQNAGMTEDGEVKLAPRTRTVFLDTEATYIVSSARTRSPEGYHSVGWCEVIDPRKGLLVKVKRSLLQVVKSDWGTK